MPERLSTQSLCPVCREKFGDGSACEICRVETVTKTFLFFSWEVVNRTDYRMVCGKCWRQSFRDNGYELLEAHYMAP